MNLTRNELDTVDHVTRLLAGNADKDEVQEAYGVSSDILELCAHLAAKRIKPPKRKSTKQNRPALQCIIRKMESGPVFCAQHCDGGCYKGTDPKRYQAYTEWAGTYRARLETEERIDRPIRERRQIEEYALQYEICVVCGEGEVYEGIVCRRCAGRISRGSLTEEELALYEEAKGGS